MAYDALIIGAGLSGLAAGIRLAMFDLKPLIVERHTEIGGLNSFYSRKHRHFDVGLHAMTNYVPKGVRNTPLGKLLKQLRFAHEDFRLCPQTESEIRFPGASLRFTNEFEFFLQQVHERFPRQKDGFQKLLAKIREFDELSLSGDTGVSSRRIVAGCIDDPLLVDMLYLPLMYYGNPSEDDMDFYQFVIMFKSVFMEGFSRPAGGMKRILGLLKERYLSLGGELRLGCGVSAIEVRGGRAETVRLDNGEVLDLDGKKVLSSAGYVETLRLCGNPWLESAPAAGRVSFTESIFVLDRPARQLGFDKSIVFYCTEPRFTYRVPDEAVDVTSGVLCCPDNFSYPDSEPAPPGGEGCLRLTNLASYSAWDSLPRKAYLQAKKDWRARALAQARTFFPDFGDSVVFLDTFTPKTILRYTGHINGAVYGSPNKIKSGVTPVANLYICGTDQGFLGIVGASLSGISMANLHLLRDKAP